MRRRVVRTGALVGLALILGACGTDEGSSGSPDATTGSTAAGSEAVRSSDTTAPASTASPSTVAPETSSPAT
ncbi:MAG: D-alanyl-D-alanine carboxypeptidase family protein, partial [Desertimonas sp.]